MSMQKIDVEVGEQELPLLGESTPKSLGRAGKEKNTTFPEELSENETRD